METTQPPPPPPPKRLPSLKLTANTTAASPGTAAPNTSFSQSFAQTPATPSQGPPKIRLVSKSQPSTPADANPPHLIARPPAIITADGVGTGAATPKIAQTKAGRISKPSAKKRARDDSDDDVDGVIAASGTAHPPQPKKTKITLKPLTPGLVRQPTLKLKPTGRAPHKPLGEGYDSEAEDREDDPVIEESIVFRMMPGEHCEYVRKCIQEKKIGIPKSQGGADLSLKWLDDEGRRAAVTVQGQIFAAVLVDLPTITEGMKTWDKKAMVKSSDICQMLLVFARAQSEEEAKTVPLPKAVEPGFRWPHGITPPMHDARNRRFRKRLSKHEIKNKEAEVERLLESDRAAVSVRTEWMDNRQPGTADEDEEEEEYEEDAEGEADDYFGDADLERQLEEAFEVDDAALEAEFLEAVPTPGMDLATPGAALDAVTPGTANAGTPLPQTDHEDAGEEESDEDEEEEEEEDGDEDEDGDNDEDEHAGIRNEIADLKRQLKQYEERLAASGAPIMRKRLEASIKNIKSEIGLKMAAIGEVEED